MKAAIMAAKTRMGVAVVVVSTLYRWLSVMRITEQTDVSFE
jgi:spore maturation protein SpmA